MDISELLSQPHHMNPGSAAPYLEGFAAADGVGRPHCVDDQLATWILPFTSVDGWKPVALTSQT